MVRFFCDGIREAREFIGCCQEDLAEQTGIKGNSVSEFEKGSVLPSTETLIAIANALNVSMDTFYKRD